jgi:hypothetical protein
MTSAPALRLLLVLVVVLAGALGWSSGDHAQASPSPASSQSADAAPRAKAYAGLARRGFRIYLHFRAQGEGPVTVNATLRVNGRLALSGTLRRVAPYWDNLDRWTPRPIKTSFPAGVYSFCVVAVDSGGKRAKSCALLRVV